MTSLLSNILNNFFASEKSSGLLLIACTLVAIGIANSPAGLDYVNFWQLNIAGLSIEHWVNDALMAIFFLLIGLELKREIYVGKLAHFKNALLPIIAAIGGMLLPALIHFLFNQGTPTQNGIGIPMATDIAFALGVLAILGKRIPASLKVFVVAFAVIDDLGAIIIIAVFYTSHLSIAYLFCAAAVWAVLFLLNRKLHIMSLSPYVLGGALMWFFMLKSGVHASVAGVMLAFAIPFSAHTHEKSPSHRLEHFLHKPVAFLILPIFALANTGVSISNDWLQGLADVNSMGIMMGLVIGKPLGIGLLCYAAVVAGICTLPSDLKWAHIVGAGCLGGIGFTMSIFITNLAFIGNNELINSAKMAVFLASLAAGILGFLWLRLVAKAEPPLS